MSFVKKDPEKVFMKFSGYDDGRNIKKKDTIKLFSALEGMAPETAAKTFEQFPYLVNTAIVMARQY